MATIYHKGYMQSPREKQIEIEKRIEEVQLKFNENAPEGINKGWQIAYDHWAWQNLRGTIISNCIQGILFSLLFALIVMVCTTGNIWISLYAVLSISSVILFLMGVIKLNGGNFGIIESTCVIVFIGLSVDYIVHISHQYTKCLKPDRLSRTNFALGQMGPTIFGGAITSMFSAFFLLACQADSLNKFGQFLATTIAASFFTSLVFLPALLLLAGPEGESGKIFGRAK
jgi:predicted RND superfamily exporter protein